MVYILDQRLRAQNIPDEKAKKGIKYSCKSTWVGRVKILAKNSLLSFDHSFILLCKNLESVFIAVKQGSNNLLNHAYAWDYLGHPYDSHMNQSISQFAICPFKSFSTVTAIDIIDR